MASELIVPYYRGYTHAVFNLLQSSSVASSVGSFVRDKLVEREWQPEHMEQDKHGHWFRVRARLVQKYMYAYYDQKEQKLYIPIAFCDAVVNVLKYAGAQVEERRINDYELRNIDISMRPEFHDKEHQIELIQKCSERVPGMKGLAMQTGRGKSYSAIKAWVNLGYAGLVIVKGLMDQWIQSIRDFTDIDKEDIYKIQEFSSLSMLAQHPEYKPKMFVASLKTLQLFSEGSNDYDVLPWDYKKFLATYGIGVKIVDECHQCFHATTMMDLRSNVPYNMYCSATFTQSSKQAKDIFLKIFPKEIQYGMAAYDRYVECYVHSFSGEVLEKRVMKKRGYSHVKYEQEIMVSERKFHRHLDEVLCPLINMYYINRKQKPEQRLLIFCSSIEFIESLTTQLKKLYPDHVVKSYIGGNELHELNNAQIIISTPGKASTGLDLKNLICTINTVSFAAEASVQQLFGRLRKIEGMRLAYVDIFDTNIPAQIRHADERRQLFKRMCSRYFEYNGIQDLSIQTGEIPNVSI